MVLMKNKKELCKMFICIVLCGIQYLYGMELNKKRMSFVSCWPSGIKLNERKKVPFVSSWLSEIFLKALLSQKNKFLKNERKRLGFMPYWAPQIFSGVVLLEKDRAFNENLQDIDSWLTRNRSNSLIFNSEENQKLEKMKNDIDNYFKNLYSMMLTGINEKYHNDKEYINNFFISLVLYVLGFEKELNIKCFPDDFLLNKFIDKEYEEIFELNRRRCIDYKQKNTYLSCDKFKDGFKLRCFDFFHEAGHLINISLFNKERDCELISSGIVFCFKYYQKVGAGLTVAGDLSKNQDKNNKILNYCGGLIGECAFIKRLNSKVNINVFLNNVFNFLSTEKEIRYKDYSIYCNEKKKREDLFYEQNKIIYEQIDLNKFWFGWIQDFNSIIWNKYIDIKSLVKPILIEGLDIFEKTPLYFSIFSLSALFKRFFNIKQEQIKIMEWRVPVLDEYEDVIEKRSLILLDKKQIEEIDFFFGFMPRENFIVLCDKNKNKYFEINLDRKEQIGDYIDLKEKLPSAYKNIFESKENLMNYLQKNICS